jgi:hypothetical protein
MKHVVEYKLHGGSIPYFIQDGGYFYNNGKLIGLTKDDVTCYVPPATELVTFTSQSELEDHVISLTIYSFHRVLLNEEQKRELAATWWNERH